MPEVNINNNKNAEKIEIDIDLSKDNIFMMGDKPTRLVPGSLIKYTGRLLGLKDNIFTIGVCVGVTHGLEYREGDIVDISYIRHKSLYSFDAIIMGMKKASKSEDFKVDEKMDLLNESGGSDGYDKYLFNILPITKPEKHQRREFYRMPLRIDIYYKAVDADKLDNITDGSLKFDSDKAKEMKKNADGGLLEKEGYSKLTTMDMSAGGFKCRNKLKVKTGDFLDCLLMIDDEALPAVVRILSANIDEYDTEADDYYYDIRALFYEISDPARDRLVKYIFYQERQIPSELINNSL